MKTKILAVAALVFSFSAHAEDYKYSLLSCTDCFNFTAPQIFGAENINPAEIGLIVYDNNLNAFRGFTSGGSWVSLSKERKTPIIKKYTSVTPAATYGVYSTPISPAPLYIRIRMVGGGGGGGGGGAQASVHPGTPGGVTSFGSNATGDNLLIAGGGGGGIAGNAGGGVATIYAPATGTAINGSAGTGFMANNTAAVWVTGGTGGASAFGGSGGGRANSLGTDAAVNSGSGGGGGGATTAQSNYGLSGGGSGAFIDAILESPSGDYKYVVGSGGAGGASTTNGYPGGAGGSGYIEITEYYQ